MKNPFLTIGLYVRQVMGELGKTVTPTVRQWAGWSLAGLVFVILLMLFAFGTDMGLGQLTLRVFG